MSGIENIELLEAGIRAEHLRQKAISSNIANIETPGYRRFDIRFEELLAKAIKSGKINVNEIEPEIYKTNNTPIKSNGNDVSLETEVGQMVKNSLLHKTYVRLLNKKYQQLQQAINVP